MTILEIALNMGWAGGGSSLANTSNGGGTTMQFVEGDHPQLAFYFMRTAGQLKGSQQYIALPANWSLLFTLKESSGHSDVLASMTQFGIAKSTDADGAIRTLYTGMLNLATREIAALFAPAKEKKTVKAEMKLMDVDGVVQQSFQWTVDVYPSLFRGEVAPEASAKPEYPPPGAIPRKLSAVVDVPAGADRVFVPVDAGADYAPWVTVARPSEEADLITALCVTGVTRAGFWVELSAAAAAEGYKVYGQGW